MYVQGETLINLSYLILSYIVTVWSVAWKCIHTRCAGIHPMSRDGGFINQFDMF